MLEILSNFSYVGIALVLLFSGFMPFPEDLPLLVAGYLCGIEEADLIIMIPLAVVGVVSGDFLLYWLGRKYGHHVPKLPIINRYLNEKRLRRAERAFNDHGGKTMVLARFLPGLRAPAFFTAGTFRVPLWKFVVYDGCVAVVTVPIVVTVGWWLGGTLGLDNTKQLWHDFSWYVIATVVVLIAGFFGLSALRKRRQNDERRKRLEARRAKRADAAVGRDVGIKRAG